MTPAHLTAELSKHDASLPLRFTSEGRAIGGGYHITELKRARIDSMDCGQRRASWTEVTLQLLDGGDGPFMAVGKFLSVMEKCAGELEGADDAPLRIEFAFANDGLQTFELGDPEMRDHGVEIELRKARAVCKPVRDQVCCGAATADAGDDRIYSCC